MTLQDFIRDSLLQISGGIQQARDKEQRIAPHISVNPSRDSVGLAPDGSVVYLVDFDVAVTVSEKSTDGLSGGISVASVFKVEGKGGSTSEQSSISRVRFSVPVILTEKPHAA